MNVRKSSRTLLAISCAVATAVTSFSVPAQAAPSPSVEKTSAVSQGYKPVYETDKMVQAGSTVTVLNTAQPIPRSSTIWITPEGHQVVIHNDNQGVIATVDPFTGNVTVEAKSNATPGQHHFDLSLYTSGFLKSGSSAKLTVTVVNSKDEKEPMQQDQSADQSLGQQQEENADPGNTAQKGLPSWVLPVVGVVVGLITVVAGFLLSGPLRAILGR